MLKNLYLYNYVIAIISEMKVLIEFTSKYCINETGDYQHENSRASSRHVKQILAKLVL